MDVFFVTFYKWTHVQSHNYFLAEYSWISNNHTVWNKRTGQVIFQNIIIVQRADLTCGVTSIRHRWFEPRQISDKYSNFAWVTWHVSYKITTLTHRVAIVMFIKGLINAKGRIFLGNSLWLLDTSEYADIKSARPGRAHNSSPHNWYCHFWDWHNWYLTLLIKLKLILVSIGTLNYWYWAQFTLKLLKLDISDLQNDWHLQVLIFGIIGISHFWFLELFIFHMSDIEHDWYMTWLTLAYLIFVISGIEHNQNFGVAVIIDWFMMPKCLVLLWIW